MRLAKGIVPRCGRRVSLKKAYSSTTRLFIVGLGYALFQVRLLKHTGLLIVLGQGKTVIQQASRAGYRSKGGKQDKRFGALKYLTVISSHVSNNRELMFKCGAFILKSHID